MISPATPESTATNAASYTTQWDTITQICAVDNGKARFLEPDDLLEEINQPNPMVVGLKQHYIRLFEFRDRLLTRSLEEQPGARKIIRMLIGYNDGALAQAKAGIGSSVGLQPTRPAK